MTSSVLPFLYLGLGPLLQLVATIFLLVALTTTSWMTSEAEEENFGLFTFCASSACDEIDRNTRITDTFTPIVSADDLRSACLTQDCVSWVDTVESVRFLTAAAMACALFALVLNSLYTFRLMTSRETSVGPLIIGVFCGVMAVILSSVSCDVYTREVYHVTRDHNTADYHVGYSLVLAATGGAVSLLAALVAMVAGVSLSSQQTTSDHFLHSPPGGRGYSRHHDQPVGHVSWVERGTRRTPLPGSKGGQLPPLMGQGHKITPGLMEKSKLPPLQENKTDAD